MITGPDTNHTDGHTASFSDKNPNDYTNWRGTSFSAPHVAGLAAELIDAWGGSYVADSTHALKIKGIILMTASELNTTGELTSGNNPSLNRGGKDRVEGYGRINADAAIDAITLSFTPGQTAKDTLGNGYKDKKVWARKVTLAIGTSRFLLSVPTGADYDMYLYSWSVDTIGEPIILARSTTAATGGTEFISFSTTSISTAHLVVKWVSGYGDFTITSNGPSGNNQIDFANSYLNAGTAYNGGRRIVRDGKGYLHMVYTSDSTGEGTGSFPQVWYSYALAPGTTSGSWSTPINISYQSSYGFRTSSYPSIAIDSASERLYVVWQSLIPPDPNYSIWFATNSNDTPGTSTWSIPSLIWDVGMSLRDSYFPAIDVSANGVIHVVWQQMGWDPITYKSDILYAQSNNTGNTWINTGGIPINYPGGPPHLNWPDNVSNTPNTNSQMPSIACAMDYRRNDIHVVWNEDSTQGAPTPYPHIWYRHCSWNPPYNWDPLPEDISASIMSFNDGYPCIAVDTGNIPHVVWTHNVVSNTPFPLPGGLESIYYSRRTPPWLGMVAENTVALNTVDNQFPSITIQPSQHLDVVWAKSTSSLTDQEIYYRQDSFDLTFGTWKGWSTALNLSNDPDQRDWFPNLAYKKHGVWNGKKWQGIPILTSDDGYDFVWTKGNSAPYGIWFRGTAAYNYYIFTNIDDRIWMLLR